MRLSLSAALISPALTRGSACCALTWRGAKIFGPRIGLSTGFVEGEDGALIVSASDAAVSEVATLMTLEMDEMDW